MSSNTIQNKKNYFLTLSKKIYLTPSESVLEDCCEFLDGISSDILSFEKLDVSSYSVYYGRDEFSIPFMSLEDRDYVEENKILLDSITENYEFTNIRSKDKEER